MKKLSTTIILLLFIPLLFIRSEEVKKDTFFERVNTLSTQEIIQLGDHYQKESDTAIALYSISNRRYNENMNEEEKQLCVTSFLKTGDIYYNQGNYTNAFDHYIQGLKICESCLNKERLPDIYLKLGSVYCTFLDYEMGISYYERAYDLSKTYPNPKREYSLLTNLAGAYNYLNNIEEAKKYYYLSVQLTHPKDTLKNYMNLLNWGLILVNEKKYTSAIKTFHQSVLFANKCQMEPRYECSSYEELYKTYQLMGNNDSTLYYLKKCSNMAQENGLANILIQSMKAYSDLYEKMGNPQSSLLYKGKYLSLADSIFNVREFNRVKHTQSIYEMEKTNKEISFLNAEKEQKEAKIKIQRKVLWGILSGLLIISGFLLFVYYQKKRLSQAYKNLFNVNLEIIASDHYNKTLRLQYEEKLQTAHKALEKYQNTEQKSMGKITDADPSPALENLEKYPHIIDITREDIDTQILTIESKALITDYSSIYIDYLLLDRPILFYCYDYKHYLEKDREMYFEYEDVTPGEKAENFDELFEQIKGVIENGGDYGRKDRERVKNMFYCKAGQGPVGNILLDMMVNREIGKKHE